MKTLKLDDVEFSVLYCLLQDAVFDMEEDVRPLTKTYEIYQKLINLKEVD